MAEGNRKDPRARVLNMTVRYKSATVDEFIENHSHDISKGGIFIKTRSPFPAGTLLKFEVRIAEDQKLMQGVGRVVWRREPDRAEENFPAGMGIKFIKTAEGSAELISQIVAARQGAESSFDAGVRESGVAVSAPPPGAVAFVGENESARPTSLGLGPTDSERTPALQVESGPRSWPIEAETTVSSPPKKRPDQAPEKRKVVLQGPALESPSSQPKPVAASTAGTAKAATAVDERAPSRAHSRQALAEETTARRIRPATSGSPQRPTSPSVYGLVAILGAIALGVVLLNRSRSEAPEEALPPATAAAPPPAQPAPAPPSVAAEPPPAEPVAETPPEPVEAELVEPPASAAVPSAPAAAPPAAAPSPAAPPPAATAPAVPAKPPSPPPTAAPAPRPVAPAPARPKPAPSTSQQGVAIIKPSEEPAPPSAAAAPPSPAPAPPSTAPAPPSPPPPAAAAPPAESPPEKKKPAASAPSQPAAPAPAAPAPAPGAPASDDNPY